MPTLIFRSWMKAPSGELGGSVCKAAARTFGWWALFFAVGATAAEQAVPLPVLHTAEEIRQLTPDQAARHYSVRLRGTLTFFDQTQYFHFFQDDTAGIYLSQSGAENDPRLQAGASVEVKGQTSPGEYAPVVVPQEIQILGQGQFPAAKPVTFEQLASGQEDSQFLEVRGIVRSVRTEEGSGYSLIDIATGGGRLTAYASQLPVAHGNDLVDSTVKVRGVCITSFNRQRQLFDIRLLLPRPMDLMIEQPAPSDPFNIPAQRIESLLRFTPQGTFGHRVKVVGTVIYYRPTENALYIEDKAGGLHVESRQAGKLLPGEEVEVLGFPAKGDYTPMLQDAVYRKTGSGPLTVPDQVTADEALRGTHDCRLVRIEATLLDRAQHSREQFVVLQAGGFIFHAYLERSGRGTDFAYPQNGSKVAVTGVCLIEPGNDWKPGETWRAKSFRLLLRRPGDIYVLKLPPWWNLQKLLWVIGALVLIALAAFGWVGNLRHRVHKQTKIIRQKLEAEAALKERYEDLFENANDIVYTHDLTGRITSINKAGERLLQRARGDILSRELIELVTEEQRPAATQWLEQVVKGAELPAAEWDFVNAGGQRHKLEINTRIVEQGGKRVEVEGIARDITERKRLEREILEISTREQRRIGHDLHDGVCQQLACIAYLTDILADRLQKKHEPESAEAEKIGGLLNDAITQARSIARGLFPVHLVEEGLACALEELATTASNLFEVDCRFSGDEPLPALENGVSLHLYYIAQEAVLNAAKHGNAKNVVISLMHARDRFTLAVKDDGLGFPWPGTHSTGMGIRIMHYRARVIGANLDLKSQAGHGTQVTCILYASSSETLEETNYDRRSQ